MVAVGITIALVSGACSSPSSEGSAQLTDLYDEEAYCAALDNVFLVKDASPDLFVEALERAARVAPPEHRQALLDYRAASNVGVGEVLTEPSTMSDVLDLTRPLHYHAIVECGIEIPGIRFEGENRIFSPTFSSDDSDPDENTAAVVTATDESTAGFYVVPPRVGGTEQLPLPDTSDPESARAAIEALVPDEIALTFEWDRFDVAHGAPRNADALVPAGWNREAFDRGWELSGDLAGAEAYMFLSSGCISRCETGPWAEHMGNPDFSPFRVWDGDAFVVLVDQQLENPDGRLIVRRNLESGKRPERAIEAIVARWDEDADWIFRCTAWTPQEAMGAWRSLASACLASTPDWFS